jgi:chromosome partitioning protein
MIIVIGGVKGGTGKTTIATNLTVLRAADKKRVLLLDADEHKSAATWNQQRESQKIPTSFSTFEISVETIENQVKRATNDYDDIIIDSGGSNTVAQRSALIHADIYLIPFQPSSLDIWKVGDLKLICQQISAVKPKIKIYVFINRGDIQGNDNGDSIEILRECSEFICLPFVICQRKAFKNAACQGLGVIEGKKIDKKAIAEMKAIYNFIYQNDC